RGLRTKSCAVLDVAAVTGSIAGVSALDSILGSMAGTSTATGSGAVSTAGEIDGDSTMGNSLLTGAATFSGFAAVSLPVISISLRLAMAGPRYWLFTNR